MKKVICTAAAFTILFGIAEVQGQQVLGYAGHTGQIVQPSVISKAAMQNAKLLKSSNINFTITYEDASGFGFDDATHGANRKQVLENVLDYIGNVIGDTGNCHVHVRASLNSPGSGTLASAGTYYFVDDGFFPGFAFEHITTGIDPLALNEDIFVEVNFGKTWNSTMAAPGGSEFDLFTVLLHEVGHGLGFTSLSGGAGASVFSPDKTFTTWDDLLHSGSSVKAWNASTQALQVGNVTGGNNTLFFHGSGAQADFPGAAFPPIYTPNPFESGSSVAHWQLASPVPSTAVMRPSVAPGVSNRVFHAFEIAALEDLGYTLAASNVDDWINF